MKKQFLSAFLLASLCGFFLSCSINNLAMKAVADALTGDGSSDVFTGDSDPKLVGDALPFAIKLYETLLDANPDHLGLRLTTGSLFIMYANAYVQGPAEMMPSYEWEERRAGLERAKNLYLRGYEILTGALELRHKGFNQASVEDGTLQAILQKCNADDVGLLYWSVAGGLSAYSIDVMDFELSSNIYNWTAMINRAYEINPNFQGAALDEFFLIFYASLPEALGGDIELAKHHFNLALEKTGGKSAGAYVSYAQSICIPEQDYDMFLYCIENALAIDPNDDTSTRLMTIITQQKAAWLLENAWYYFSFLPIPDYY